MTSFFRLAILAAALAPAVLGQATEGASIEQRLGEDLPLESRFVDDDGRTLRLGGFFSRRPVVLALVYYRCPMLCNLVAEGLVSALRTLPLEPGRDFEVVFVSIDPEETPDLGRDRKRAVLARYGRDWTRAGWHFLTGQEREIRRLADAVGFRYSYVPETGQFVHGAAILVATPAGRISRYFYGVEYPPRDLRLGLVEASSGQIGSPIDQVLLLCFQYDPSTGKYTLAILGVLRAFGAVVVVLGAGAIALALRRERRARRHEP